MYLKAPVYPVSFLSEEIYIQYDRGRKPVCGRSRLWPEILKKEAEMGKLFLVVNYHVAPSWAELLLPEWALRRAATTTNSLTANTSDVKGEAGGGTIAQCCIFNIKL